eukprot:12060344-Heterocapsa_arctica.AAC.1
MLAGAIWAFQRLHPSRPRGRLRLTSPRRRSRSTDLNLWPGDYAMCALHGHPGGELSLDPPLQRWKPKFRTSAA